MDLVILTKTLQETVATQSKLIVALGESNTTRMQMIDIQMEMIGGQVQLIDGQAQLIETLNAKIKNLEKEIAILKNKKNSNNSHIPPSKDENRPKKNQSLREKTDREVGGQKGHEGATLEVVPGLTK